MPRFLAIAITIVLVGVSSGYGQKSTEIYIPIGKSPGLSGKYTTVGEIESADEQNEIITMSDSAKSYTVHCDEETKFWLDRTEIVRTNLEGAFADCQPGRLVEVKYRDNDARAAVAEWIKIRILED